MGGQTSDYSRLLYRTLQTVLYALYRLFFGFESYGSAHVPDDADGRGVILAANHASFLDPPILGISQGRHVTYLAKEYLFKAFFVGWMLRRIGALPVRSEAANDFKALRRLLGLLKEGRCVAVFPEGTRSEDGEFGAPEAGDRKSVV